MLFEPRDDTRIPDFLCGLAQDIGIEKPAHNFRRLGNSRRLGGRSSIFTGQAFSTFNLLYRFLFFNRLAGTPSLKTGTVAHETASNATFSLRRLVSPP